MTARQRDELLATGVTRRLPPGRRMFAEGGTDTHVEVIRSGYVKVSSAIDGVPRLLAIRLPGDLVGELGAVAGIARIATVTTGSPVVSTQIRQADLLAFLGRHPGIANRLTAMVGRRLRWANLRRADSAVHPVQVRLARVLVDIAASCGEPTEQGLLIGVGLSHTELATLIGAAEDTVQRGLRLLRERGLIGTGYRRITVLDMDGLRDAGHDEP